MKDFDFLIFIGRFQPFHKGHSNIVNEALLLSDKLIMLLGSANKERSLKNPFTFFERAKMIKESAHLVANDILFRPLNDYDSDNDWIEEVKKQVIIAIETTGSDPKDIKIGLIGMNKDDSTYYLQHFPFWDFVEIDKPEEVISATEVREWMFGENKLNIDDYILPGTYRFLKEFKKTDECKNLKDLL